MGYWSIVVPEATKNYVKNPSLELDTTGHTSFGAGVGTRTRVSTWQKFGVYSLEVICTTAPFGNVYVNNVAADMADFAAGDILTFSVYVKVLSGTLSVVASAPGSGVANVTSNIVAPFDGRVQIVFPAISTTPLTSVQLYTYFAGGTGTAYIDGLQIEKKSYATTYCDGEQEGCSWAGTIHNSKSLRDTSKSTGGREYNLDDLGYYVTNVSGIGMPPVNLISQLQALLPGALLRDFSVGTRTIQLGATPQPTSQSDLHSKRKAFLQYIRPDKPGGIKPFILRYTGANSLKKVDIEVVYDSGLEYNAPEGSFFEEIALRLMAFYPYWKEEGNRAYALSYSKTLTSHNYIYGKEQGVWKLLGTGLSSGASRVANVIKKGSDGRIYVGGLFDGAGGVATTRGFAVWNPDTGTWSSLNGQVAAGGNVYDIAFAPNGDIVVVGVFTDFNGVANTANIARWVKATSTWTSITSTVANNAIYGAAFDHSGNLYVVGDFTAIGGVGCVRVAKYDGSTWSQLGTGFNARGWTAACSPDNYMYFGGLFTTANGVTVNYIAKWNGTTFEALASGGQTGVGSAVTSPVLSLLFARDGSLNVGGIFQSANGETIRRITRWNGTQFQDMGDVYNGAVANGIVEDVFQDSNDGDIVIFGQFDTAADRVSFDSLAYWNGSIWSWGDVNIQTNVQSSLYIDKNNMYLGFNSGSAGASNDAFGGEITTVNYEGTSEGYPVFRIKRSGGTTARIKYIQNLETNAILWVDHSLQSGEELTIDLTPGERKITSSFRGNSWNSIIQSSNLTRFTLQPGSNRLLVFIETTGSPTIEAFVIFENLHWAADGVAT